MKKRCSILSVCFFLAFYGFSQKNNPVITAVPSLTIAPDARAGAMGDVGAATQVDVNSQYWNPAKYAFMESSAGVAFSYTPWLSKLVSDINLYYLAGFWKFDPLQSVSASLRYFSLGDIDIMDEFGYPQGAAHPNEFAFDIAYSRLLSTKFSGSVAFRYIRSDLNSGVNLSGGTEMYPGNAFAADIAGYFKTPIYMSSGDGNLAFGFNISNIGSKISYDEKETSYFIPTNLRLGGSFEYPIDDYNKISFNADINKLLVPTQDTMSIAEYSDISSISGIFRSFSDAPGGFSEELQEVMWSVGAEYVYNKQFSVRAGYFHESQNKGNRKYFTVGAGFKLNVFELDAGYVIATNQSNPLDQTLRFTLAFDINGLKNLIK
ncbi:MAG TPA: type IX secretion system outer membrane channel protein PorV [Paludibacteraceae bacterium]|nr:type IX secretion system outer membrane channel protein PorV [Paludibacteraceae bacterium]HOL00137.1 type IX secretion system outer membrane channel protein PorV [Paludibacteraceae bacterium]HPO67028.1 type IX secretion system outer membrane channel protein PorV [Paludibacteraceae bacterium]HRU63570.1 type IX secretion system outer membrane channel protein PorV [Paludibacteraceae bacterium]